MTDIDDRHQKPHSRVGLLAASTVGAAGLVLVALTTPFLLPALRRHCLPYVPATNDQLANLKRAFTKHSSKGDRFLDIGSGDGRICRLASEMSVYSQVDGVELNNWLVLYSRLKSIGRPDVKFYHRNLWKFPLHQYESICIFGVDTMMQPLEEYLGKTNTRKQTIFACRFPFKELEQVDEIGRGIDTVWVYKLGNK